MQEELNLGKITAKFAIKFVLWTILFFVIGFIIVGIITGGAISSMDSSPSGMEDLEDMFGAIKGFIYGLVFVDLIAALLATKLSIGGITKKVTITAENRPKIFKNMMIVLIVMAVVVILIHTVAVKSIDGMIVQDIGEVDSLGELIKDAEDEGDKIAREFGIDVEDELDEALSLLKGLNTAGHIYSISGLLFVAMIPVANALLKKKEQ